MVVLAIVIVNLVVIVSILDGLDRRQWVKEEDLAKVLRLHPKQLRRTLRVLEEEMLVIREHRREVWLHFPIKFSNPKMPILNCWCFELYYQFSLDLVSFSGFSVVLTS